MSTTSLTHLDVLISIIALPAAQVQHHLQEGWLPELQQSSQRSATLVALCQSPQPGYLRVCGLLPCYHQKGERCLPACVVKRLQLQLRLRRRVTSSVVARPAASNDAALPLALPPFLTLLLLSPTRCGPPTISCTRLAMHIHVLVVRTEPSTLLCTATEQQAIL